MIVRYTYGEPVRGSGYLTTCVKKGYYWNYNYGYGGGYQPDNHLCHLSIIDVSGSYPVLYMFCVSTEFKTV